MCRPLRYNCADRYGPSRIMDHALSSHVGARSGSFPAEDCPDVIILEQTTDPKYYPLKRDAASPGSLPLSKDLLAKFNGVSKAPQQPTHKLRHGMPSKNGAEVIHLISHRCSFSSFSLDGWIRGCRPTLDSYRPITLLLASSVASPSLLGHIETIFPAIEYVERFYNIYTLIPLLFQCPRIFRLVGFMKAVISF
ncbi:hypothetical protein J6590_063717 [Homalodisca vitripennis]|nr:hypothetical protein J6590_063717 [Homalodisca vitripennis]